MKASEKVWNENYTYKSMAFCVLEGLCRDAVNDRMSDMEKDMCYLKRNGNWFFKMGNIFNWYDDLDFPKGIKVKVASHETTHECFVKVGNKWISWDDFDWEVE